MSKSIVPVFSRACGASLWFLGLLAAPAVAHSDIELSVENGRLVAESYVAESNFGEGLNPPNFTEEPGFDVEDGGFNPGDSLGFNVAPVSIEGVARHLWFWDGTGAVAFGSAPTTPVTHQLEIKHPLTLQSVRLHDGSGATMAPGFFLGTADAAGGVHIDPEYRLVSPMGDDILAPADGVYLFGVMATSDQYAASDPIYIVIGSEVDDVVLDAAVDYVTNNIVPEPSSTLLALGIGLGVAIQYLRRRIA